MHRARAAENPLSYFVAVVGDVNFRVPDKPVVRLPDFVMDCKEPKLSKMAKSLKASLEYFTRIEHDSWSHLSFRHSHLNDIDFIFISSPGWSQLPWSVSCVVGSAEDLYASKLNDHAPVVCSISVAPSSDID